MIKMEILPITYDFGDFVQNVGDFSDENALKVAVNNLFCVNNSLRHVSRYSLTFFCN